MNWADAKEITAQCPDAQARRLLSGKNGAIAILNFFAEGIRAAEARIFTKRTTLITITVWSVLCAAGLGRQYFAWHWPYIPTAFSTGCVDFGWTWISGRFAALHDPARIFDYASFAKAQADLFGAGKCTVLWSFPYPPTMLFFAYPFGLVPFATAYVLWSVVLTTFLLGAVYAIVRRLGVVAAAAMKPAITNIYLGQNAFLTAGLLGFALTMLERRPVAEGFLLALLTYKPQYGILIPIALIASRNWRALVSATAFSVAFAGAAAFAFGSDGWSYFLSQLMDRNPYLAQNPGFAAQHYSVYGILQTAGFGATTAWVAHGTFVVILGLVVWRVWSKPLPFAIRASLLCVASLLATPYVLYYDLSLLVIAFAFLIGEGLRRGFLTGERTVMTFAWFALSLAFQSVALVICAALLWLIYRRVVAFPWRDAQALDTRTVKPVLDIA